MDENEWPAKRFTESRARLRAVAHRMLGSVSEAEDALQEAWLKLSRSDASEVKNLDSWLTTLVARVCLDILRSRRSRREEPLTTAADRLQGPRARRGGSSHRRRAGRGMGFGRTSAGGVRFQDRRWEDQRDRDNHGARASGQSFSEDPVARDFIVPGSTGDPMIRVAE